MYAQIYGSRQEQDKSLEIFGGEENYLVDSKPIVRDENIFDNEINHFIDCIQEGKQPIATAEDGYFVQKMLNGIYDSIWVEVDYNLPNILSQLYNICN